jgi:hypothetical protein
MKGYGLNPFVLIMAESGPKSGWGQNSGYWVIKFLGLRN